MPPTTAKKIRNMRGTLLLSVVVAWLTVLGLSSCDDSKTVERTPDPLQLREVIPADSVVFNKGELIETISMRFNRPADLKEVSIAIFPEPSQSSPLKRTSTGHTLFFNDVIFSTRTNVHWMLIDGTTMPAPRVVTWWDGVTEAASLSGKMTISSQILPQVQGADAIVFLLPLDTGFDAPFPETIADARPLAVHIPSFRELSGDYSYFFNELDDNMAFYALAIFDTNDDGIYHTGDDWWGSYGTRPGFLFMETVVSEILGLFDSPTPYDFPIQAPVQ